MAPSWGERVLSCTTNSTPPESRGAAVLRPGVASGDQAPVGAADTHKCAASYPTWKRSRDQARCMGDRSIRSVADIQGRARVLRPVTYSRARRAPRPSAMPRPSPRLAPAITATRPPGSGARESRVAGGPVGHTKPYGDDASRQLPVDQTGSELVRRTEVAPSSERWGPPLLHPESVGTRSALRSFPLRRAPGALGGWDAGFALWVAWSGGGCVVADLTPHRRTGIRTRPGAAPQEGEMDAARVRRQAGGMAGRGVALARVAPPGVRRIGADGIARARKASRRARSRFGEAE